MTQRGGRENLGKQVGSGNSRGHIGCIDLPGANLDRLYRFRRPDGFYRPEKRLPPNGLKCGVCRCRRPTPPARPSRQPWPRWSRLLSATCRPCRSARSSRSLVAQVKAGEAILDVKGQPVTVRPAGTLQAGLDPVGPRAGRIGPGARTPGPGATTSPATSAIVSPEAGRLAVVDVLLGASGWPGAGAPRWSGRSDGLRERADSGRPARLAGGANADRADAASAAGHAQLTAQVAGAILRGARPPDLGR